MNNLKKISFRSSNLLSFLCIVLLVEIFFWKVFLRGQVPIPGDFVTGVYYPWIDYAWEGFPTGVPVKNPITADVPSFMYPMQTLAVTMLRKGTFPLWNPLILTGTPLLANFQSAPFSPTNFFYFFLQTKTAWSMQVVAQHIMVALCTFLLLRHWKCSKFASVLGGIAFAFSGYNLIWSQWNGHTLTSAFIPLTLLFVDRWLIYQKRLDGVWISVSLALQIFSGYPQSVFYTCVGVAILWVFRLRSIKRPVLATFLLSLWCILALGVSAVQILPGKELLSQSQREVEPHPYEWAFLPWQKTITFLAPDYFGNHATNNYWGPQDYTSNTGFVGVIVFSLALLAIPMVKKDKNILYAVALCAGGLILSYPTPLSILIWKSGVFGMQAASAHRALVLWNLGMALLAAHTVDAIQSKHKFRYQHFLVIPLIIFVVFGVHALSIHNSVALRNLLFPGILFLCFVAIWFLHFIPKRILLFSLIILELFRFGWKFTPFAPPHIVFPTTPELSFLQNQPQPFRVTGPRVIPINMRMPYGLESLEGYDAVYPVRISKFIAAINSQKGESGILRRYAIVDNDTSPLLDLVNTKYYLTLKINNSGAPDPNGEIPAKYNPARFTPVFENKSIVILESKTVLLRAFMVYDWDILNSSEDQLGRLIDPTFTQKSKILIEKDPGIDKGKTVASEVTYTKYDYQQSEITVKTQSNGILFVSDSWFPGWKAFIDGKETEILKADYAFRGVVVPQGNHTIKFTYLPDSFVIGLKITLLSIVIIVGIAFSGFFARRKYPILLAKQ
jgi:hypothetical protein